MSLREDKPSVSKLGFPSRGSHCCAFGCNHKHSTHTCSFISFPKDPTWKAKWVSAVKRMSIAESGKPTNKLWTPKNHHRLCTCHFSNPPNPRSQKMHWNHVLPDLLPGVKNTKKRPTNRSTNRSSSTRRKGNEKDSSVELEFVDTAEADVELANSIEAESPEFAHIAHDHDYCQKVENGRVSGQFEIMKRHVPEFHDLLADYKEAKAKADQLDSILQKGQLLSLEAMKEDDVHFQYYTGLPSYAVFTALFNYLKRKAGQMQYVSQASSTHYATRNRKKPGKQRILSLEEEFFATLVRLRLGLAVKDISRRLGIAESTFSNIFNTWIIFLADELEEICVMPRARSVQAQCFDSFSNVRIVLDCTEVFSQTPSSLTAHKHLHSNYKHHSTVKFLVGMSPSGAITYVSDMWGGRASDKRITASSDDLLAALDTGDKVMVDRGFTISEDLPDGVKLIIPPFKNKSGQLTSDQLEYSEKISVARIHVERAMKAIKECRILDSEVKLAMIGNFENLFKVCAYLVNFKTPFLKCNTNV